MKKVLLITILFAVTGLVAAQEQGDAPYNGGGAPDSGRSSSGDSGVARLSLIRGDVSMQRGDSGDWVATTVNTPIVRGDTVATSEGGRAEIQLDYAHVLRLSSQTQVKVADLTRGRIQVQVAQGYANLSSLNGGEAEVEIDTPNVSVHPAGNGKYRVEVNSDSETNVIVREGEAEVSTSQGSTRVREGEVISVRGTNDPEYKVSEAPGADDWDQWNRDRDNTIRNAEGVRRTNPYYQGAQDLDAYGRWVYVPGYGQVWQPSEQPANWAPYQAGRWVWEPYYGWTWVSYEPWGWAPYHYGRWFYYGTGWYWWPGPITPVYRPVWSPAFVTFIGFGRHVGFGFGFGSIGWFPCGPFDTFYPWWGGGFNRFGVIDVGFFFHDHDHFRDHDRFFDRDGFRDHRFGNFSAAFSNPRVRSGITSVSAENFGRGGERFEHGMDEATLRQAHVAQGNLGVVPTHESLSARGFASAPSGFRAGASSHFFTRTQTTAGPSFQEQTNRMQEAIRAHGMGAQGNTRFSGNTGGNGSVGRGETGNISRGGGVSQGGSGESHPGWHTFSRGQGSTGQSGNDNSRFGSHTFGGSNPGNNGGGGPSNNSGNRDFHTFNQSGGINEGGRGSSGGGQSSMNSRRLDLSKPIVVPRGSNGSASTYNGGGYNGSRGNSGYSSSSSGYNGGRNNASTYNSRGSTSYSGRGSNGGSGSRGSSGGGGRSSHSSGGHSDHGHR